MPFEFWRPPSSLPEPACPTPLGGGAEVAGRPRGRFLPMASSPRRRSETPWGPWEPYEVAEMAAALREVAVLWWVAGGCALEAFVGRRWREHEDVDFGCFREDAPALRRAIGGWDVHVADPPGTLRRWAVGEPLPPHAHGAWVRERAGTPWRFQCLLDEREGDSWVYRRDARIRRPVASLTWERDGVRHLAPEIQLLYKSKDRRPKDETDFREALPRLDGARRLWLADALRRTDPAHAWLPLLA